MTVLPRTALITVLAAVLVAAGCSDAPMGSVPPDAASPPGASFDTTTVVAGGFVAADGSAADPEPSSGWGPSFNESGGCGAAQGVRGPYMAVAGNLDDSQRIWGPWADVYGRTIGEVRANLVEVTLPMTGEATVTVWVHRRVLPALEAALANLADQEALGNSYELRAGEVGSFRPATVPPNRYLSFHAVGAAVDVNSRTNPYSADNELVTDMPGWFVESWTDAGWCWGGDWETVKDAMHFSWQGPLYTPGGLQDPPSPPLTAPDPYRRSVVFPTSLGPAPVGSHLLMADLDRDGAPDAIRVHPWTADGRLGVEVAQALYGYRAGCTPLVTSPVDADAAFVMADGDYDGRPDLWEIAAAGDRVTVTVHTHASGYSQSLSPRQTGAAAGRDASYLAGDLDLDGAGDLWVVTDGTVEVWAGPSFTDTIARTSLPPEVGEGWRFGLGDFDLDWVPDLFALGPSDPAALVVLSGTSGLTGDPLRVATGVSEAPGTMTVADLDGDGRPDLLFSGSDGTLTAYLGGDRSGETDADLVAWFLEPGDQSPTRQKECPVQPGGE